MFMRSIVGILIILTAGLVLGVAVFRNTAQPQENKPSGATPQAQGGSSTARPSPSTTAAQSRITVALNVSKLTDRADLIVVGQVTEVNDQSVAGTAGANGATPTGGLAASLQVMRVIKGSLEESDGQQSLLSFEMPYQAIPRVGTGTVGVFFLKQTPSHTYTVADSDHPYVLAKEPPPANLTGDALNQVAAEVAGVLESKDASIYERKDAIFALRWVKTEAATTALRRAARDENAEIRLLAMGTLLGNGDITVLGKYADALLNASSEIPPPYTAENLSGALRDIENPKAIPTLRRLLHAQNAGVRANAAAGLRHIGTDAVIAPLSEALDDSDQFVRFQAVRGLETATGETAGNPSFELFKSEEQAYISYWKERVQNK
jgi:hypothetical protein